MRWRSSAPRLWKAKLDELVRRGAIRGYDLATRYVPSLAAQQRRLAALPEARH